MDNAYAIYTPFGTDFSPVYKYRIVGGQKTLALEDKYNKQNLNKVWVFLNSKLLEILNMLFPVPCIPHQWHQTIN